MKAVVADISQEFLKQRKRTGADRYDEMWEGVLHMPPMPNRYHQDLESVPEVGPASRAGPAAPGAPCHRGRCRCRSARGTYFRNRLLNWALETFLRLVWMPTREATVHHDVNVAPVDGWRHNYRAPDLIILLPERFDIDHNEYFEGAPNVVVEIHSPGDETYEKLEFYADLGVPEVWIIDRDSGNPERYQLKRNRYKKKANAADGWLRSGETGVELRCAEGNKLAVRLAGDESSRQDLPPD